MLGTNRSTVRTLSEDKLSQMIHVQCSTIRRQNLQVLGELFRLESALHDLSPEQLFIYI